MADLKEETRIVKIGSTIYLALRGSSDEAWLEAKIEKALRAGREVTENGVTRHISWGIYADDMTDNLERHIWNAAQTKVQGTLVEMQTKDGETTKTTLGKKFKSLDAAWGDNSDVPGKFD